VEGLPAAVELPLGAGVTGYTIPRI
jgi:hypothetical protein